MLIIILIYHLVLKYVNYASMNFVMNPDYNNCSG